MLFCAQARLHVYTVQYGRWRFALSWFSDSRYTRKRSRSQLCYLFTFAPVQSVSAPVESTSTHRGRPLYYYACHLQPDKRTTTIWPAFQIQHLPCAAMFWFKCLILQPRISLFGSGGLGPGSNVPGQRWFHTSVLPCRRTQQLRHKWWTVLEHGALMFTLIK